MAIYSLSLVTTVGTTSVPSWDCRGAANSNPRVMELGVSNGAATAITYGYGRSANTPVQSSPVVVLAEGLEAIGLTTCAVAWTTAPTVPANFFRRYYGPAVIGSGIFYTFPRGISLAAAGPTLVQWNLAASSALVAVHVVVDE